MRPSSLLAALLPAAVTLAAACSAVHGPPHGTGGGGGGAGGGSTGTAVGMVTALAVSPQGAVLEVSPGAAQPVTQAFTATVTHADKTTTDVSASAVFTVDDATLGGFTGATFTAKGAAGTATVTATADGLSASATLTLKALTSIVTTGAPADAPGKFGGAVDPSKTPAMLYPADGVLVPPNMNVLEFQFQPGPGNNLFELTFSAPTLDVKVYLVCAAVGAGCAYTPDAATWKLVSDAARGKDPVTYTLRGTDVNDPKMVGVSTTRTISFAQEDLVGGLYYWNAGAGSTMRYEFGKSGQTAELYMNAATAGAGVCVGCHVLSRDGTRIAEGLDIPGPAGYKVFDVATKTTLFSEAGLFSGTGANFFSFSPDNTQLLASSGTSIALRDAATGKAITDPLVANGAMPDWSPDGKRMIYAKGTAVPAQGATGVDHASIESMTLNGATWSAGPTLVPYAGQNNYYPSFSPDGAWVVFNRSPSNLNSYDAKDAEVWVVAAAGGTPVKLATASTGGDSWAKWTPSVQMNRGGPLLWLTFSSRRAYGLRLPPGQTAQIWMVAFDPTRAAMGMDPSSPPFWLPFQDLASGNHIAQWVVKVERKPCAMTADCNPGEQCLGGTCEPVPQ